MFVNLNVEGFKERDGVMELSYDKKLHRSIVNKGVKELEVRIKDPRIVTREQQKKIYALIAEIAYWNGDAPEDLKEIFKYRFCAEYGYDYFSLSHISISGAREFIDFLVKFAVKNQVPMREQSLREYLYDMEAYLYTCIEHRVCSVCGLPHADIHHLTGSRVGMGRDRKKMSHTGLECIALCREHHNLVHAQSEIDFMNEYKFVGTRLDAYLCEKIKYVA